ncbi:MAG: glyoxalase [Actinomycetota bacterium]
MSGDGFQLTSVTVGDDPSAWTAAGFEVHDGAVRIGSTAVICDPDARRGIAHVAVDGVAADIDGLPIRPTDTPSLVEADHPNLVSGFDHLVAMSPAIDRTADALLQAGLDRRRTRRFDVGGETRRQDFFWLGDVILELVGVDGVDGEGPATFWGLALECADLDLAAARLGDALGTVKDAVQPGRRIATVRTRELGISVPIALMSPHERG